MGRAYAAISIVTVLWATNFTVAKIGTREFDPFFIASFRVFVTSTIFTVPLRCTSRLRLLPRISRLPAKAATSTTFPAAHAPSPSNMPFPTPSDLAVPTLL